jgi:hypothetical protein
MKWVETEDFFDEMDRNPQAVYVVQAYSPGLDGFEMGVFSTKAKAEAWCNRPEFDDRTCAVSPFVIDEPEFGNKQRN